MEYKFNGEVLNLENLEKAREWFIKNAFDCIKEAEEETVFVNDLEKYRKSKMEFIDRMKNETNFSATFLQRAYYFQTGKSIALLP